MAKTYVDDTPLQGYSLPTFKGGYNSYSASKLLIQDDEFPQGATNVVLDDNGSVTKRAGQSRYSAVLTSGHAVVGLGGMHTATVNKAIVANNTAWYDVTGGTNTALTGVAFTADLPTDFEQADGKLFGANGTDALAFTSNGTSITSVGSNGNIGRWPTFFNQRLYMTNTANADRIYYSNPISIDLTTNPPTYAGLDTSNLFNTDLTANPKKTAGYIILLPGGGVVITRLFKDTFAGVDYLFVYTKEHGVWRIQVGTANSDGSLTHSITQAIPGSGSPAGASVGKGGNDQWFFDRPNNNFSTYGEAQGYFNPRVTAKGGRVKQEISGIATNGINNVAFGHFKSKDYFSYQTGTYNDRVIVYDEILNAWSAPFSGWNINRFLVFTETDGTRRFLGASSNPSDPYVFELEVGSNDVSTAVAAMFQTKSTDCKKPGLVKYFGFIDVFYGQNFGTLTYTVYGDEINVIATDSIQIGSSASNPVGIGTVAVGTFPVGAEYNSNTTFATLSINGSFRIDCGYSSAKRIAVQFANSNSNEQFKINGIEIRYIYGQIYQTS